MIGVMLAGAGVDLFDAELCRLRDLGQDVLKRFPYGESGKKIFSLG